MKNDGNFEICLQEAYAFKEVAEKCYEDEYEFMHGLIYPYVVNIVFSCELFLKAIAIKNSEENEFSYGHDLKELFENLESNIQNDIEKIYNLKCPQKKLTELLIEIKDSFIDWRYAFEKPVSACITGLQAFSNTLQKYIEQK